MDLLREESGMSVKRGRPHRHNSKYKKGTDGNETNRTKENMQEEKLARTERYIRRGTRRIQSATQRPRALPSALRAMHGVAVLRSVLCACPSVPFRPLGTFSSSPVSHLACSLWSCLFCFRPYLSCTCCCACAVALSLYYINTSTYI